MIPPYIGDRLDMARSFAAEIADAVDAAGDGCDILLCGSSLDPENHSPHDMDLAVVLWTGQSTCLAATSLRTAMPDARIDAGKSYVKAREATRSPVHLWLLSKKDISGDKRIQETLLSGRQYDRKSSNWMQPIHALSITQ